MAKKSIVLELQKELLDNAMPLSQLTIKAYVVARKLNLDQFIEQFRNDIEGYPAYYINFPDYRKVIGQLKINKFGNSWEDVNKKCYGILKQKIDTHPAYVRNSVRNIELLSNEQTELSESVDRPFNSGFDIPDVVSQISSIRLGFSEIKNHTFKIVFNSSQYQDILHNLKMYLIDWTLMLTENGIFGWEDTFEKKEKEVAQQIVNNGTMQVQNNPNNSEQNMTINNNQLEVFDKLLELANTISNNNTIIENINEMKSAVEQNDKKTFGEKYNKFITSAANHMTLFSPLLPSITAIL